MSAIKNKPLFAADRVSRSADACECPKCSGYAPRHDRGPTEAEIAKYQMCGRSWACCLGAFKCKKCGSRVLAHLAAPEMG